MTGRTYLSIGDVLTLLRREFPDVTISKIRFLESQGLVNPERTPSGYRKFYEQDVERLKWVLRQQREHFLPLKVIKGRLEEETSLGGGNGSETQVDERQGRTSKHPAVRAGETRPGPVITAERVAEVAEGGQAGRSLPATPGVARSPSHMEQEHGEDIKVPAGRHVRGRANADVEGKGQELPGFEASEASQGVVHALVSAPRSAGARPASGEEAGPTQLPSVPRRSSEEERERSGPRPHVAASAAGGTEDRARPEAENRDTADTETSAGGSEAGSSIGAFSGTSMTREEIAAATRLSPSDIQQLESFGLLSGRAVGGVDYFDEAAFVVANLAAAFSAYGVEARHLRLHLLSAQREAGFIEQIVLPLLKQRNPTSRQRAHETVADLMRLGQELHAALLDKSLRELLGG